MKTETLHIVRRPLVTRYERVANLAKATALVIGFGLFVYVLSFIVIWKYADAGTIATIPNQGGTKIHITDSICRTDRAAKSARTQDKSGRVELGCWVYDDQSQKVFIQWNNGDVYGYHADGFTLTDYAKKKLGDQL